MIPSIEHGNVIRVAKTAVYLPGDIIAYVRGDGTFVSHRMLGYVAGRRGLSLLCRSDTTSVADSPVSVDRVIGRVSHIEDEKCRIALKQRFLSGLTFFPAALSWFLRRVRSLFAFRGQR